MSDVIDIHPHVISPDTDSFPLRPLGGTQSSWSLKHPLTYDELIAAMDAAGIAKAAVVQASTAYGHDNSYLAKAVARHPNRFTGVFSADILAEDASEKIDYWRGKGLTALRLFTAGTTMEGQASWLNDPKSHNVWDYCSKIGMPVCVQMRPKGIPLLHDILKKFPNSIVIIDHFARSVFDDGAPYQKASDLWGLAKFSGVYLKLTHRTLEAALVGNSNHEDFFRHVLRFFPADRIAWGSNFPAAERPLSTLLAEARAAISHLDQSDQDLILGGVAKSLFPSLQ